MTSLETLNTKIVVNELSFLLVTPMVNSIAWFGSYRILKSGQGAGKLSGQIHHIGEWWGFGTWKRKTCWGVNMDSEDHLLSFPTPTHTHIFDTHIHSYGHFGAATCGVIGLLKKQINEQVGAFSMVMDSGKIMTFKIVIKLL
jgi:hypothetical protein